MTKKEAFNETVELLGIIYTGGHYRKDNPLSKLIRAEKRDDIHSLRMMLKDVIDYCELLREELRKVTEKEAKK